MGIFENALAKGRVKKDSENDIEQSKCIRHTPINLLDKYGGLMVGFVKNDSSKHGLSVAYAL